MSVVGFDIGNLNCYIAVARQGGIEVITNDYSLHATPACVSFGSKNRQMGVAARQQVNTNFKNTIINFKHLVGRKFSDPITQKFVPYIPCQVVQLPDDHIGFKVYYLDEERVFTPEQILAALLTKLKIVLESGGLEDVKKVTDCVVTVPTYFTDIQRRAVAAAVHVAGLNQLRILNESTATALAYGIYKQDLPEESAKPKHVLFLDVGHSATQTALVAYHKGKLSMLGSNFSLDVGGLLFDVIIRDYFRKLFIDTYKIDAKTNPRAWLRLLDESEKVKKQMSANSTPIPLNIECFMEDKDVTGKLQRVEFEELAAPLFEKVRVLVTDLLAETRKQAADVDEIEIIGGSSRIPAIRKIVHDIFGKEPKTTMNQDEAVARGAAMQCAILSPSFRVREFSVKDAQPFGIRLTYEGGESDVFVEKDEFPFSKLLTFYRDQPFQLDASYTHPNTVPQSSRHIGSWRILNVVPQPNGDNSKVKVKVRVNPNGVFSVSSASMFETVEVDEKEEEPPKTEANGAATDGAPAPPAEEEVKEKKKKTKTTSVELPIQELLPVTYNVDHFVRVEQEMRDADLREKKKADAKNSVEEYVYDMRDKLSDSLVEFISEKDAEDFRSLLTATEDWLYDEGEDAPMAHYEARLADLKKFGEPVVERYREFHSRQTAFDQLDQSINRARKAFEEYAGGSEAYAHIESKDMEKVLNAIDDKKKWVDEQRGKQERRPKTEPPVVFTHEIKSAQTTFENVVLPILNKPKPKPPKVEEPPPPPPTQPQQQNNPPTADGAASQEQMDVE